jgi:hypothetical protein
MKIGTICEGMPGAPSLELPAGAALAQRDVYLGIQRGNEIIEAVPADQKRAVFESSFRVSPM